jgi:hypothetical protein
VLLASERQALGVPAKKSPKGTPGLEGSSTVPEAAISGYELLARLALYDEKIPITVLALCPGKEDDGARPGEESLLLAVRALELVRIEAQAILRLGVQ